MADDDFRAKAMAMYQTRGKAATAEAAKAVKSSVRKDKGDALAKDDYRSMASKLYKAKGTEKLCEDCSKAGTRNARKKTAYYGARERPPPPPPRLATCCADQRERLTARTCCWAQGCRTTAG